MSTVTCDNCGTINVAGSEACSFCGAELPSADQIICPKCGSANDAHHIHCANCGQWLRASAERLENEDEETPVGEPDATSVDRTLASWLSDVRDKDSDRERAGEVPDWLRDSSAAGSDVPAPGEDEELPDWLQELGLSGKEKGEADQSEEALPDWQGQLGDARPDSAGDEADGEDVSLPEQLGSAYELDEDATFEASGLGAGQVDLPDWLRELRDRVVEREKGALDETQSLPDDEEHQPVPDEIGLNQGGKADEFAGESMTEQELPDWLVALEDTAEVDGGPAADYEAIRTEDAIPTFEDDVPAWLADLGGEKDEEDLAGETGLSDELAAISESAAEEYEPEAEKGGIRWDIHAFDETASDMEQVDEPPGEDLDLHTATLIFPMAMEPVEEEPAKSFEAPVEEDAAPATEVEALVPDIPEPAPAEEAVEEEAEGTEERDELGDWLREMAPRGTGLLSELHEVEPPSAGPEPVLDEDAVEVDSVPDWLADLVPPGTGPLSGMVDEEAEWGLDILEEPEMALDEIVEKPSEPELDLDRVGETVEVSADRPIDADEDLTSWLQELTEDDLEVLEEQLSDVEAVPTPMAEPAEPSKELDGVPGRIASPELPEWLHAEFGDLVPADTAEMAERGELPDWMDLLEEAGIEPSVDELWEVPDEEGLADPSAEWGALLADIAPEIAEVPADQSQAELAAELSEAEIPEWLQAMRPGESPAERAADREMVPEVAVETSGPLAGLSGIIQIESVVAEPRAAALAAVRPRMPEQERQIALLRKLTTDQSRRTGRVIRPQPGSSTITLRLILGGVLLIGVLINLLLPTLDISPVGVVFPPASPAAADARAAIEGGAGQTALLAFDYAPASSGELNTIAELLLQQLADHDYTVVTMSQLAPGVAIAEQQTGNVEGLANLALGYAPGREAALRRLGSCLGAGSSCETLFGRSLDGRLRDALADTGLIVILTADRDSLINWLEQVGTQVDLPIVAGLTQALAPVAAPYVASDQLSGMLTGVPGTAAYEREFLGSQGRASDQLAGQILVEWLVIGTLVVGGLYYGLRGFAGSRGSAVKA